MLPSLNHFHFPFFPSQGILHNPWEDPADRRMASHSVGTPGPYDLVAKVMGHVGHHGSKIPPINDHISYQTGSWDNHGLTRVTFNGI